MKGKNYLSPLRCGVCKHPEHERYERQLLKGEIKEKLASEKMGVARATLSSHLSTCLPHKMNGLLRPEPVVVQGLNCVNILVNSHNDLRELFDEARAEGDIKSALKALEVEIRQVHEIATLTGQTADGIHFNLVMLPEYVLFKQTVLAAVSDYPEVKARISKALRESETTQSV